MRNSKIKRSKLFNITCSKLNEFGQTHQKFTKLKSSKNNVQHVENTLKNSQSSIFNEFYKLL